MLKLYNTLSRTKETFVPIEPGRVRMYVCGMTVYDYCHIGHARVMVVFDVVQRWLRASGFRVTYVRNITDIDDKIIRRAAENGEAIGDLTARFIRYMDEDAAALGVQKPDHEPRATEYIPQMLAMIGELESNGLAYRVPSGDVNYPVRKFPGYGKLSGKSLDELRAGERVEIDREKQDPLDFVLWKHSQGGEPAWPSPFGDGRPGWHIECSAMSSALLGRTFDIHGGGEDLQFPHHENEIAQSEGAHGGKFVNYWMHNGFVRVDDEKMSKSLGNFFTVREVLPTLRHPEVLRYFILSSHYRGPINYSLEQLDQAEAALRGLYTALQDLPEGSAPPGKFTARFEDAMDDDFNTPEALAVLQALAREVNLAKDAHEVSSAASLAAELRSLGNVLGLLTVPPSQWFRLPKRSGDVAITVGSGSIAIAGGAAAVGLGEEEIDSLIEARVAARKAKNWAESDRIRDELAAAGIILEDRPGGKTVWRRA